VTELPETQPRTPRQRFRAQIREEIKQAALRQLANSGPAGVSVNAIGKELGVSGPALYRYFASRDELLTELVIDAYDDLAAALHAAINQTPTRAPRRRFEALAHAYRAWALAQPHRYRLLFGPPLPGYDAHTERLISASKASMDLLVENPAQARQHIETPGSSTGRSTVRLGGQPRRPSRPCEGPSRHPDLEPPTRLRKPSDRRQLRLDGHRPRPTIRDRAPRATRLSVIRQRESPPGSPPVPSSHTPPGRRRHASLRAATRTTRLFPLPRAAAS